MLRVDNQRRVVYQIDMLHDQFQDDVVQKSIRLHDDRDVTNVSKKRYELHDVQCLSAEMAFWIFERSVMMGL